MEESLLHYLNRLQVPFSWHVAAELCWRVPGHRVYETHPGGGQYDCLSIAGPKLRVDINRGGSMHAWNTEGDYDEPPVPHDQVRELSLAPDGVARTVAAVLRRYDLSAGANHPATTAEVVTYRVIAAALTMHFFRKHWDCRAVVAGHEDAQTPGRPPVPDFAAVPANEIWTLTCDGAAVTHLARGWAVAGSGERVNLLAAYDRGESVEALAARLTARPARRTADLSDLALSQISQCEPDWHALG